MSFHLELDGSDGTSEKTTCHKPRNVVLYRCARPQAFVLSMARFCCRPGKCNLRWKVPYFVMLKSN